MAALGQPYHQAWKPGGWPRPRLGEFSRANYPAWVKTAITSGALSPMGGPSLRAARPARRLPLGRLLEDFVYGSPFHRIELGPIGWWKGSPTASSLTPDMGGLLSLLRESVSGFGHHHGHTATAGQNRMRPSAAVSGVA